MSLSVLIYYRNEELIRLPLDREVFKIGRSKDADLQLMDPSISSLHLLLRRKQDHWSIQDVSQNGVNLESQRIPQRPLPLLLNTHYQLSKTFSLRVEEPQRKNEPTRVLQARTTQLLQWDPKSESLVYSRPLLRRLSDQSERYIQEDGLSLGRHPSNDWAVSSDSVSQFHARIELRSGRYHLVDLGSTNGTSINEQNIVSAELANANRIQLGDEEFEFVIEKEHRELQEKKSNEFFGIQSKHSRMRKLFSLAETVAPMDSPVFISGETGTGKELMARAIHQLSSRFHQPFVAINCAAIPKELLESELFGHEKGAFSGAESARKGAFESADRGTLFLDEIGELSLELQAKILRALENGEVKRLGSDKTKTVDIRLVSATHQKLIKKIEEGDFREDLYFRIHVIPLHMPSLRERIEDIELLAPNLLQQLNAKLEISSEALRFLKSYAFPGNIRELKNILQRGVVEFRLNNQSGAAQLEPEHFNFLEKTKSIRLQNDPAIEKEKQDLIDELRKNKFNQTKTAKSLDLAVSTLHDRVRRLGIDIPALRKRA